MRLCAILFFAAVMAGCASAKSWTDYAAQHSCMRTEESKLITTITTTAGSLYDHGYGPALPAVQAIPIVRRAWRYECDNGFIWSYQ